MKKILFLLSCILLGFASVSAADVDTSIEEALKEGASEEQDVSSNFNLKTFESCSNLEEVMEGYIKDYYEVNKNQWGYNRGGLMFKGEIAIDSMNMMEDSVMETSVAAPVQAEAESISAEKSTGSDDFSKTNTQVDGVDESDIIKTDGKYVYYYNQTAKKVFIIEAYGTDEMSILKEIALPKMFSQPVLYIGNDKLIIVASGYSQANYSNKVSYINRNAKTYTVVFDVKDKSRATLEKLYVADGNLQKTRKIGNKLYVISNNNFSIPYYNFASVDDIDVNIGNIIPKKLEVSRVDDEADQNLKIRGKSLPYNISAGNAANCSDIEYSLPDEDTLEKYGFNPSYNIISIIDVEDASKEVSTKVIAGNNSEIYMSLDNLYLTESVYQSTNYACPINARCIMPMFYGGMTNTLLHKMNIEGDDLSYQNSAILPGMPLTQYSMDEKDENFRIITTTNNWNGGNERHTDLYILDKNLEKISSLNNLGEGENFQSSRFMGDKLFLVTFKQVDPFYVIDLEDQKNPEVIGELKIPGYSTYLHPYDENHLIGLGFDTYETDYGATRNGGLKVDLYEINYDKKTGISTDCENYSLSLNRSLEEEGKNWECPSYCKKEVYVDDCTSDWCEAMPIYDYKCVAIKDEIKTDYIEVKQKFSYTLGDEGSYSEATYNPRMFMWNDEEKALFLPATLYTKFEQGAYRNKDFFQGLVTLEIDKDSGISEKYRITHLDYKKAEEDRINQCSEYTQKNKEKLECKTLIDGSEYCPSQNNNYVPEYCYSDSTVGEYLANNYYEQNTSIVQRALWIGDNVYSVSDKFLLKSDINNGIEKDILEMK